MKRVLFSGLGAVLLLAIGTTVASADQVGDPNAFICPVVGEGVLSSPQLDAGAFPGGGATFLPGNEQAGGHANENGLNAIGAPSESNRPGAVGFTPIWNPPNS